MLFDSMESRRVAFFTPSLEAGGAERVVLSLANAMNQAGYKVDVVMAQAKGVLLPQIPPGVTAVDLCSTRVVSALTGLIRYMNRSQPEVLIAAQTHANLTALLARRFSGVATKVIVTEHSTLSRITALSLNKRGQLLPLLAASLYRWADAIVAVSKGVAIDLAAVTRIPVERIRVIYNPLVTPDLLAKKNASLAHPWFGKKMPPVILSVGRLTAAKDFPTLIRAFDRVRRYLPAKLLILGEGEERAHLERLIGELELNELVHIPGYVENPYPYMSRANVFVLSSKIEGLPSVLVEAMACGAPVIATDCPSGPSEILEQGRYGRLVPVGDADSLAKAVVEVLSLPPDVQQARERAMDFSLERSAAQYSDLISEILGSA